MAALGEIEVRLKVLDEPEVKALIADIEARITALRDEAVGLAMLVLDLGKGGDLFVVQDCARGFLAKHKDP